MKRTATIILNYNGAEDTVACVRSLESIDPPGTDVYIVDNASTDDSVQRLRRHCADHRLIMNDRNAGYAGGNNLGIREALRGGYEYLLILNNDTVVSGSFLRELETWMDARPSAGIAAPLILYHEDPTLINAGGGRISALFCAGIQGHQGEKDPGTPAGAPGAERVSFVSGCAMMIRREVIERIGMFDERYFMYFEDVEYCVRAIRDYELVYVPASRIYHKVGAGGSRWKDHTPLYNFYYTRNRLWFFRTRSALLVPYVFLFSLTVVLVKTGVLLGAMMSGDGDRSSRDEQLRALWSGLTAGLRRFPGDGGASSPLTMHNHEEVA